MSLRSRAASLSSGVLPAGPQVEAGVPEEPVLLQAAQSARHGVSSHCRMVGTDRATFPPRTGQNGLIVKSSLDFK